MARRGTERVDRSGTLCFYREVAAAARFGVVAQAHLDATGQEGKNGQDILDFIFAAAPQVEK